MMFTKVVSVAIAVNDVEEAARTYSELFGLRVSKSGPVPEMGIKNAIMPIGDVFLELMEPLNPTEGPVAKFLQKRGEGIYLIQIEVEDLGAVFKSLQSKGTTILSDRPEEALPKRLAWVHPKATRGVLIELVHKGLAMGA